MLCRLEAIEERYSYELDSVSDLQTEIINAICDMQMAFFISSVVQPLLILPVKTFYPFLKILKAQPVHR